MELSSEINKQACPAYASSKWDPATETDEDKLAWFKEFTVLPRSVKYGLVSSEVEDFVKELFGKYSIKDLGRAGEISRLIREVFTKKISKNEVERRVDEKFSLSLDLKREFVLDLKKAVVLVKNVGIKTLLEETDVISLIPALKKYEEFKKQEIGNLAIKVKGEDEERYILPTIKNWVDDYIQRAGAHSHSSLERSGYFYNQENPKRLSVENQAKLMRVLESYDNDTPLFIDKNTHELITDDYLEDFQKTENRGLMPDDRKAKVNLNRNSSNIGSVVDLGQIQKKPTYGQTLSSSENVLDLKNIEKNK